jgi:serine/threonine-protein kinase HipA
MQGLDSFLGARWSSYPDILDALRARSANPARLGQSMFSRIVFNIAIGNIDDHARNHAAFWDGNSLELTPAYDLCPQPRSSETAKQAMDIDRNRNRDSQFALCVEAAHIYGLSKHAAREIIQRQIEIINDNWSDVADLAQLTTTERKNLWKVGTAPQ